MKAEGWTTIHQIEAVTDQPQCWMAHSRSHATDLAVASFTQAELQPSCRDAETGTDRWIALSQRLPMFGGEKLRLCRSCASLLDHYPIPEGIQLRSVRDALNLHPVSAPVAESRVREALLQATIGSQQQQALAVGIKPTCCIDIRNVHPVGQASPLAARFRRELAQNSVGLVEQKGQEWFPKQINSASPQLEALLRWSSCRCFIFSACIFIMVA